MTCWPASPRNATWAPKAPAPPTRRVRDAIDRGWIPGPRLRVSGNAIDILGGHEDANGFNPEQHALPNATYANSADELVAVIRAQAKQGADFVKIYETGKDRIRDGAFHDAVPVQRRRTEALPCAKRRALDAASPCMRRANPAPAWPRAPASPRSIMPTS